jgi:ssDNA-binding Zn-finger/Zn-ribbon topoisomerase 1
MPAEKNRQRQPVHREDWVIVAIVFVVASLEALMALAFIPVQLLPDALLVYVPGADFVLIALSALCGWYVAKQSARERRKAREIEALPTQLERLSVEPEKPHLRALDYCLLLPIFLFGHAAVQVLIFIMVLDQLLGLTVDSIPYRAQFAICAVLGGALTFSDTRARIQRRHRRALDRRARQLAKRATALSRNRCPSCDYNISKLPERRCPECGERWTEDEEPGTEPKSARRDS